MKAFLKKRGKTTEPNSNSVCSPAKKFAFSEDAAPKIKTEKKCIMKGDNGELGQKELMYEEGSDAEKKTDCVNEKTQNKTRGKNEAKLEDIHIINVGCKRLLDKKTTTKSKLLTIDEKKKNLLTLIASEELLNMCEKKPRDKKLVSKRAEKKSNGSGSSEKKVKITRPGFFEKRRTLTILGEKRNHLNKNVNKKCALIGEKNSNSTHSDRSNEVEENSDKSFRNDTELVPIKLSDSSNNDGCFDCEPYNTEDKTNSCLDSESKPAIVNIQQDSEPDQMKIYEPSVSKLCIHVNLKDGNAITLYDYRRSSSLIAKTPDLKNSDQSISDRSDSSQTNESKLKTTYKDTMLDIVNTALNTSDTTDSNQSSEPCNNCERAFQFCRCLQLSSDDRNKNNFVANTRKSAINFFSGQSSPCNLTGINQGQYLRTDYLNQPLDQKNNQTQPSRSLIRIRSRTPEPVFKIHHKSAEIKTHDFKQIPKKDIDSKNQSVKLNSGKHGRVLDFDVYSCNQSSDRDTESQDRSGATEADCLDQFTMNDQENVSQFQENNIDSRKQSSKIGSQNQCKSLNPSPRLGNNSHGKSLLPEVNRNQLMRVESKKVTEICQETNKIKDKAKERIETMEIFRPCEHYRNKLIGADDLPPEISNETSTSETNKSGESYFSGEKCFNTMDSLVSPIDSCISPFSSQLSPLDSKQSPDSNNNNKKTTLNYLSTQNFESFDGENKELETIKKGRSDTVDTKSSSSPSTLSGILRDRFLDGRLGSKCLNISFDQSVSNKSSSESFINNSSRVMSKEILGPSKKASDFIYYPPEEIENANNFYQRQLAKPKKSSALHKPQSESSLNLEIIKNKNKKTFFGNLSNSFENLKDTESQHNFNTTKSSENILEGGKTSIFKDGSTESSISGPEILYKNKISIKFKGGNGIFPEEINVKQRSSTDKNKMTLSSDSSDKTQTTDYNENSFDYLEKNEEAKVFEPSVVANKQKENLTQHEAAKNVVISEKQKGERYQLTQIHEKDETSLQGEGENEQKTLEEFDVNGKRKNVLNFSKKLELTSKMCDELEINSKSTESINEKPLFSPNHHESANAIRGNDYPLTKKVQPTKCMMISSSFTETNVKEKELKEKRADYSPAAREPENLPVDVFEKKNPDLHDLNSNTRKNSQAAIQMVSYDPKLHDPINKLAQQFKKELNQLQKAVTQESEYGHHSEISESTASYQTNVSPVTLSDQIIKSNSEDHCENLENFNEKKNRVGLNDESMEFKNTPVHQNQLQARNPTYFSSCRGKSLSDFIDTSQKHFKSFRLTIEDVQKDMDTFNSNSLKTNKKNVYSTRSSGKFCKDFEIQNKQELKNTSQTKSKSRTDIKSEVTLVPTPNSEAETISDSSNGCRSNMNCVMNVNNKSGVLTEMESSSKLGCNGKADSNSDVEGRLGLEINYNVSSPPVTGSDVTPEIKLQPQLQNNVEGINSAGISLQDTCLESSRSETELNKKNKTEALSKFESAAQSTPQIKLDVEIKLNKMISEAKKCSDTKPEDQLKATPKQEAFTEPKVHPDAETCLEFLNVECKTWSEPRVGSNLKRTESKMKPEKSKTKTRSERGSDSKKRSESKDRSENKRKSGCTSKAKTSIGLVSKSKFGSKTKGLVRNRSPSKMTPIALSKGRLKSLPCTERPGSRAQHEISSGPERKITSEIQVTYESRVKSDKYRSEGRAKSESRTESTKGKPRGQVQSRNFNISNIQVKVVPKYPTEKKTHLSDKKTLTFENKALQENVNNIPQSEGKHDSKYYSPKLKQTGDKTFEPINEQDSDKKGFRKDDTNCQSKIAEDTTKQTGKKGNNKFITVHVEETYKSVPKKTQKCVRSSTPDTDSRPRGFESKLEACLKEIQESKSNFSPQKQRRSVPSLKTDHQSIDVNGSFSGYTAEMKNNSTDSQKDEEKINRLEPQVYEHNSDVCSHCGSFIESTMSSSLTSNGSYHYCFDESLSLKVPPNKEHECESCKFDLSKSNGSDKITSEIERESNQRDEKMTDAQMQMKEVMIKKGVFKDYFEKNDRGQLPVKMNVFKRNSTDICIACEMAKLREGKRLLKEIKKAEDYAKSGSFLANAKKRKNSSKPSVHFDTVNTMTSTLVDDQSSVNPVATCTSFVYKQPSNSTLTSSDKRKRNESPSNQKDGIFMDDLKKRGSGESGRHNYEDGISTDLSLKVQYDSNELAKNLSEISASSFDTHLRKSTSCESGVFSSSEINLCLNKQLFHLKKAWSEQEFCSKRDMLQENKPRKVLSQLRKNKYNSKRKNIKPKARSLAMGKKSQSLEGLNLLLSRQKEEYIARILKLHSEPFITAVTFSCDQAKDFFTCRKPKINSEQPFSNISNSYLQNNFSTTKDTNKPQVKFKCNGKKPILLNSFNSKRIHLQFLRLLNKIVDHFKSKRSKENKNCKVKKKEKIFRRNSAHFIQQLKMEEVTDKKLCWLKKLKRRFSVPILLSNKFKIKNKDINEKNIKTECLKNRVNVIFNHMNIKFRLSKDVKQKKKKLNIVKNIIHGRDKHLNISKFNFNKKQFCDKNAINLICNLHDLIKTIKKSMYMSSVDNYSGLSINKFSSKNNLGKNDLEFPSSIQQYAHTFQNKSFICINFVTTDRHKNQCCIEKMKTKKEINFSTLFHHIKELTHQSLDLKTKKSFEKFKVNQNSTENTTKVATRHFRQNDDQTIPINPDGVNAKCGESKALEKTKGTRLIKSKTETFFTTKEICIPVNSAENMSITNMQPIGKNLVNSSHNIMQNRLVKSKIENLSSLFCNPAAYVTYKQDFLVLQMASTHLKNSKKNTQYDWTSLKRDNINEKEDIHKADNAPDDKTSSEESTSEKINRCLCCKRAKNDFEPIHIKGDADSSRNGFPPYDSSEEPDSKETSDNDIRIKESNISFILPKFQSTSSHTKDTFESPSRRLTSTTDFTGIRERMVKLLAENCHRRQVMTLPPDRSYLLARKSRIKSRKSDSDNVYYHKFDESSGSSCSTGRNSYAGSDSSLNRKSKHFNYSSNFRPKFPCSKYGTHGSSTGDRLYNRRFFQRLDRVEENTSTVETSSAVISKSTGPTTSTKIETTTTATAATEASQPQKHKEDRRDKGNISSIKTLSNTRISPDKFVIKEKGIKKQQVGQKTQQKLYDTTVAFNILDKTNSNTSLNSIHSTKCSLSDDGSFIEESVLSDYDAVDTDSDIAKNINPCITIENFVPFYMKDSTTLAFNMIDEADQQAVSSAPKNGLDAYNKMSETCKKSVDFVCDVPAGYVTNKSLQNKKKSAAFGKLKEHCKKKAKYLNGTGPVEIQKIGDAVTIAFENSSSAAPTNLRTRTDEIIPQSSVLSFKLQMSDLEKSNGNFHNYDSNQKIVLVSMHQDAEVSKSHSPQIIHAAKKHLHPPSDTYSTCEFVANSALSKGSKASFNCVNFGNNLSKKSKWFNSDNHSFTSDRALPVTSLHMEHKGRPYSVKHHINARKSTALRQRTYEELQRLLEREKAKPLNEVKKPMELRQSIKALLKNPSNEEESCYQSFESIESRLDKNSHLQKGKIKVDLKLKPRVLAEKSITDFPSKDSFFPSNHLLKYYSSTNFAKPKDQVKSFPNPTLNKFVEDENNIKPSKVNNNLSTTSISSMYIGRGNPRTDSKRQNNFSKFTNSEALNYLQFKRKMEEEKKSVMKLGQNNEITDNSAKKKFNKILLFNESEESTNDFMSCTGIKEISSYETVYSPLSLSRNSSYKTKSDDFRSTNEVCRGNQSLLKELVGSIIFGPRIDDVIRNSIETFSSIRE